MTHRSPIDQATPGSVDARSVPTPPAIDLRSDTVTQPTAEMYAAIASAPLGDDVFGDDPTVAALESKAANCLGMDAALFVPSGTMANLIAVAVATRPGDEIIVMDDSHVYLYEQGGTARLWGVQSHTLNCPDGCPTPQQVVAAIRPDDPHCPRTSLLCLENTHNMRGGLVVDPAQTLAISELARNRGLKIHLDGARLFNAATALDRPVADFTRGVDSVMISLSKGLSCPVGSIYAGSQDLVDAARRTRKLLGGGMRQAGILAACGLVALSDPSAALAPDHRRARALGAGLSEIPGLAVAEPQTNIVMVELESGPGELVQALVDAVARHNVGAVSISNQRLRLVTHAGIDDAAVDETIGAFSTAMEELG